MASVYGLFDYGGSIVRVADHAFPLRIQEEFFPAKQLFSSLPAVRAEVTGRTLIGPSEFPTFLEFIEGLPHAACQRYEGLGKVGAIHDLRRMIGGDVEAAGSADDQQAGPGTAQKIT